MNAETCARRREALRAALRRRGLDALLVSAAPNRYYLSGFELHDPQFNESAGRLVICADGRDWLATDARYTDAAARLWDKDRIFLYRGDGVADLARLLRSCGLRIGFEAASVSHAFARALSHAAPGLALEAADGLVEELRVIKDEDEIAALRASFQLNHAMLDWVREALVPGRTELEVSWDIERYFREHGASELAFANIVAVGPNAALPHAIPGSDRIGENCPVLLDIGCREIFNDALISAHPWNRNNEVLFLQHPRKRNLSQRYIFALSKMSEQIQKRLIGSDIIPVKTGIDSPNIVSSILSRFVVLA